MARLRYIGPDKDGRMVPLSGGAIHAPRMKWIDLVAEAEANHIRPEHAQVAHQSLITHPDWEAEAPVKAARTRKKHADPAEPEQETDQ